MKDEMIQCASCGENIFNGGYCTRCGELYCNKHNKCPRCDHDLSPVKMEQKIEYNIDIDWLSNEKITIGFNGISSIPKEILSIFHEEFSTPQEMKVIFFESKELSSEFSRNYELQHRIPLLVDFVPEKSRKQSRYSFIFSANMNSPSYILFNLESIKYYDLPFLFKFAVTLWRLRVQYMNIELPIIREAVADIHFSYGRKMGIPFVTVLEDIKLEIHAMYMNIISTFAECLAIFELYPQGYLANISDFLIYKINTHYDALDYEYMNLFKEVLSTLSYYITIYTIINYSKKLGHILNEMNRLVEKKHNEFISDLSDYPDLIEALEYIKNSCDDFTILDIDTYTEIFCQKMVKSISYLEPRYESTSELLSILKLSSLYTNELKLSFSYQHPELGTAKNFWTLLFGIFDNQRVNLRTRITCCVSALMIMQYSIINDMNYLDYQVYILKANELSRVLIDNIKILNLDATKKGHPMVFKFQDATNTLMVGSQLALMFNEKETSDQLLNKTLEISETYDLYSVKLSVLWKKYTHSHNFSYITQIYHNFIGATKNLDESELAYIMAVGNISKIFIETNWKEYFPLTQKYVEDIFNPEIGDTFRSSRSSVIYYYFIKIMEVILISLDDFSYINNSKKYITGLLYTSAPSEPLNMFAYKTEVIKNIINGNLYSIENDLKKITQYQNSREIEKFIITVRRYVDLKKTGSSILFSNIDEWRLIKQDDPWNRLLIRVIDSKIEKILVFVEGEIDALILFEFSSKIRGENDIIFLDSEGYTNMAIMIKDTKLSNLQNIPTLYIFDGDTILDSKRKKIREKLINKYKNKAQFIYTLSKNTIENYILDSKAIIKAYPNITYSEDEIEKIIHLNATKNNKKYLMNYILSSGGIGKYDKLKAQKIAHNFDVENIDEEIRNLFSNINKYVH